MLKSLWNIYFWLVFVLFTLTGILILPLIILMDMVFFGRTVASSLRRAIRLYGWVLVCKVPFTAPVKVVCQGSPLPPVSIFVANHNSAIDPYLFGAIPVENSFVTSWPFKIPVYGFFMRIAGYANAENGWEEVRHQCRKLLASGCSVTIWPEGHRSKDNKLGRFRNGAFSLAIETGYPVVPVCILGSGKILPPGERVMSTGEVKLVVLNPVYPENLEDKGESVRFLRRKVQADIEKALTAHGHFAEAA